MDRPLNSINIEDRDARQPKSLDRNLFGTQSAGISMSEMWALASLDRSIRHPSAQECLSRYFLDHFNNTPAPT